LKGSFGTVKNRMIAKKTRLKEVALEEGIAISYYHLFVPFLLKTE
jgi:hypothetical protein